MYVCMYFNELTHPQEFNPLGFWGPRKMTVLIPGMDPKKKPVSFAPTTVRLK